MDSHDCSQVVGVDALQGVIDVGVDGDGIGGAGQEGWVDADRRRGDREVQSVALPE